MYHQDNKISILKLKNKNHCISFTKDNVYLSYIIMEMIQNVTVFELKSDAKTQKVCTFLTKLSVTLENIYRTNTSEVNKSRNGHNMIELDMYSDQCAIEYLLAKSNKILKKHGFLTGTRARCEIHKTIVRNETTSSLLAIHSDDVNGVCNTIVYYVDVDTTIEGGELAIYDEELPEVDESIEDRYITLINPKSRIPGFIKVLAMTGDVFHKPLHTYGVGNRGCIVVQVELDIETTENHMSS